MKKFLTLFYVALVSAIAIAQNGYNPNAHNARVSGTDNLCTVNWGGSESGDAMTYDADDGLWKITLAAKNTNVIEFKIVYDGGWYGDQNGNNFQFQVSEASDVNITFNPVTSVTTYNGDKVVSYDPNRIEYIIAAGSDALLNGKDWDVTAEENKLTEVSNGLYQLELENVAAGNYEFKFTANGSWAKQWGASGGSENLENGVAVSAQGGSTPPNFAILLPRGAVYDVTLTLNITDSAHPMVIAEWTEVGGDTTWEPGWPSNYGGVMLQGFYWDSYNPTKWSNLTDRAQELGQFFDVIWVPQSGKIADNMPQQMGYNPVYWLDHNSCFGTETELCKMINTFHKHNTSMMAEVVLNHKSGVADWTDFAEENVYGPTTGRNFRLSWSSADICNNDECVEAGYEATGAADERDNFTGGRDLDHTGANVQANVKTYEDFLLNELGYDGFRYDMSKGYAGYYTGLYNAASKPTFSVGEYWADDASVLRSWLNDTKQNGQIQSAVFDFALKYKINEAFGGGTWSALADKGLSADPTYQRYSVSFIDNHDTGSNTYNSVLENNIPAANAFILTMPGTPCIFLKHYQVYTNEIQNCIRARKAAGIHNQSSILKQEESNGGYILETQGTNGKLYLQLGGAINNGTPSGYQLVQEGDNYKLFITSGIDWKHVAKDGTVLGHAVVSQPSGNYQNSVSLTVAPSTSGTNVVYTTDGSIPTATSPSLTSQQSFTFEKNTTLRVAVLNDNQVENVETYIYTITEEEPLGVTVYVQSADTWARIYAWNSTGIQSETWPGTPLSDLPTKIVGGVQWRCLHVNSESLNVILNNGEGGFENQTATIPVTHDMFLFHRNSDLAVNYGNRSYSASDTYIDVTDQYAGGNTPSVYVIGNITPEGWSTSNGIEMTTDDGIYYTATIDFFEGWEGYSYFGFTTRLGASWDDINAFRFGAPESDYLISPELLHTDIACMAPSTDAFKVPTGMYQLTLNMSNHSLVVEPITPPVYVLCNVDGQGWGANKGWEMQHLRDDIYTATIDFKEDWEGYSNFSFTTELAATPDDWDAIALSRFGAAFDNYTIGSDELGTELNCHTYSTSSFKIPTGAYILTLHRLSKVLVVECDGEMRGDLNGDSLVTLADLTILVNYLNNGTNPPMPNADCNKDGNVDFSDVTALANFILTYRW